jgi:hypothetical protein
MQTPLKFQHTPPPGDCPWSSWPLSREEGVRSRLSHLDDQLRQGRLTEDEARLLRARVESGEWDPLSTWIRGRLRLINERVRDRILTDYDARRLRTRIDAGEWVGLSEMISDTPEGRALAVYERRQKLQTATAVSRMTRGRRDLSSSEHRVIGMFARWERAENRVRCQFATRTRRRLSPSGRRPRGRRTRVARRARAPGRRPDEPDQHPVAAFPSGDAA